MGGSWQAWRGKGWCGSATPSTILMTAAAATVPLASGQPRRQTGSRLSRESGTGWGSHRGANAMVDGEYDHRIRKLHDGNRPFADANGRQQSQWHSYGGIRTPMVSECPLVRHCTTTSCAHCTHQPCGLVRLCTILTPSCVSLNCDTKSALPSTRTAARSHLSPKAKKQKLFVYACIGDCMCFVMYYVPKYTECLSTGDGFRTLGILVPSRQSVASDCLGYHRIRMPIARSDHRIRIGIAL